jgi:hypothetical protein
MVSSHEPELEAQRLAAQMGDFLADAERALERGDRLYHDHGIPRDFGTRLIEGGVLSAVQKRDAAAELERLQREAQHDAEAAAPAGPRPRSPFDLLRG